LAHIENKPREHAGFWFGVTRGPSGSVGISSSWLKKAKHGMYKTLSIQRTNKRAETKNPKLPSHNTVKREKHQSPIK
jgi:hypothetical protein